ncbi:hypothetical protein [Saccharopolyspora shandongensis]|uniref:hypothetical protein n=1 Tax=Saccharopolyspora shandongensis TaxID=418495 RepID=UPI00340A2917
MSFPMPTPEVEGIRLTVMPFRSDAVIGTMGLPTLLQLVPSPKNQENKRALQYASGLQRRHAEIRGLVQRMIKTTSKGKNVVPYAEYMAAGLKGMHGSGWSTPPVTLWLADQLGSISDELVPGTSIRTISVTPGSAVVAVDGETQVTAWHELYDDPARFGLTHDALAAIRVPFELYWGLNVDDARQIFYDRNVEGVSVAKNLAMSMDATSPLSSPAASPTRSRSSSTARSSRSPRSSKPAVASSRRAAPRSSRSPRCGSW